MPLWLRAVLRQGTAPALRMPPPPDALLRPCREPLAHSGVEAVDLREVFALREVRGLRSTLPAASAVQGPGVRELYVRRLSGGLHHIEGWQGVLGCRRVRCEQRRLPHEHQRLQQHHWIVCPTSSRAASAPPLAFPSAQVPVCAVSRRPLWRIFPRQAGRLRLLRHRRVRREHS